MGAQLVELLSDDLPPELCGVAQEPVSLQANGSTTATNPHSMQLLDLRVQQLASGPYMTSNCPQSLSTPHVDVFMKQEQANNEEQRYVGKQVVMIAGKYKGKMALVERKLNKKYKLHVEGVPYELEFYANRFALPEELA